MPKIETDAKVTAAPAEVSESDATILLVGAIRAAAITISSAVFYTQRVSVTPPFDAKEKPFDAAKLFDESFEEFTGMGQ